MRLPNQGLIRSQSLTILLAVVALASDAADRRVSFNLLVNGPIDEIAHLATGILGLLILACLVEAPRRFYVAGLIASVAIDLDHVPMYLGFGNQHQRPVTHSLATVAAILVVAAVDRRHRAVLTGAAVGLMIHLARDIAEGSPGVRMLWPVRDTAWRASGGWFLAMIITLTAIRLILHTVDIPRTRVRLFEAHIPAEATSALPGGP
jgi:hypothetical protein